MLLPPGKFQINFAAYRPFNQFGDAAGHPVAGTQLRVCQVSGDHYRACLNNRICIHAFFQSQIVPPFRPRATSALTTPLVIDVTMPLNRLRALTFMLILLKKSVQTGGISHTLIMISQKPLMLLLNDMELL